jgi:hypothetical protein
MEHGMVTYEITATVRADLVDAYERFMREDHIPHLLATGAFAAATLSRSAPGRYRIRYEAHSRAALDRYLAEHAPRLREQFTEMFPAGIALSREEWTVLAQWPSVARRDALGAAQREATA